MHVMFLVSAMASAVTCVLNLSWGRTLSQSETRTPRSYQDTGQSRAKAKAPVVQNNVFELRIESHFRATALFRP